MKYPRQIIYPVSIVNCNPILHHYNRDVVATKNYQRIIYARCQTIRNLQDNVDDVTTYDVTAM